MTKVKQVGFALLGCGKLGHEIFRTWKANHDKIVQRFGINLDLRHILVKHATHLREPFIPENLITDDPAKILKDRSVKIVIDAIGGIEPTYRIVHSFLDNGVNLVSANRAMLASKLKNVFELLAKHKTYIRFDAALGSGFPITRIIRRDLIATRILSMWGLISGSSNLIISEMQKSHKPLQDILKLESVRKLAESHMVLDYEGTDAAQKLVLLASVAFGANLNYLDVYAEGLSKLTPQDVKFAEKFGYQFKYLAFIRDWPHGIELRAHPTMVPVNHPITAVKHENNAYFFNTDTNGELMFYGKGAGLDITSGSIIRDLVNIALNLKRAGGYVTEFQLESDKKMLPVDEMYSGFYARFPCLDIPGVIGKVTTIFGNHSININSAHASIEKQISEEQTGFVHIFIDNAQEKNFLSAIEEINDLDAIKGDISYFRILTEEYHE